MSYYTNTSKPLNLSHPCLEKNTPFSLTSETLIIFIIMNCALVSIIINFCFTYINHDTHSHAKLLVYRDAHGCTYEHTL